MVTDTSPRPSGEVTARSSGEASSQTSAFQSALGAWRNVDLTTLQKTLDTTASEIVSSQRDSLVERKELAQKTKEYRKLSDEEKKDEWKGLLKSYQSFIDHLTTSKKNTEAACLELYRKLGEAPDPYPLLEATVDGLVNAGEVQAVEKENAVLKATVARLSAQVENMEKTVNERNRQLSAKDEELVEAKKQVEEVWRGVLDEKTRNWEGKEKALAEKLAHTEGVLQDLKVSYEVSQKMGGNQSVAEDFIGKERAAELELVTRDLERTTLRLAEVETRNEQLRLQLEKASSTEEASAAQSKAAEDSREHETTILRLQSENATLLRRIETTKSSIASEKSSLERKLRSLERTAEALKADNESLKLKLSKTSDYDDLKRELEIIKSIEFATGDDDDDDDLDPPSSTPTVDGQKSTKETLEQLLLARNKKLSSDLTLLRVSHSDLTSKLSTLQSQLTSTTTELTSLKSLNSRLEDDLQKLQSSSSVSYANPALSVIGGQSYISRHPSSSHLSRGGGRVSPTSSIISGIGPRDSFTAEPYSPAGTPGPGAGILPMVTAQRDRFKQRNTELESSLAAAQSTITSLRTELASLQKDNLALYEKTRYISTYTPVSSSQSRYSPSILPTTNASGSTGLSVGGGSGGSIERYRQAYESNISPFEAFRGRETARAYGRMGMAERMVFQVTRLVLRSRATRNLFAGYLVALHFVVFWLILGGTGGGEAAAAVAGGVAGGVADEMRESLKEERFGGA